MNQPIVIYRDADGNVGALKTGAVIGAPLTHGSVTDVGLRWLSRAYLRHKGQLCRNSQPENIPAQANVQHFPLVERNQILWIWMGDPALADESLIVDYPYHDDPVKWPHRKAMFQIKSNYMLMIDNLMDLTHLGYVHGRTIGGNPLQHVGADMDSHKTEKGAYFIRWMLEHDPPPTYQKGGQFTARSIVGRIRICWTQHRVAVVRHRRRRGPKRIAKRMDSICVFCTRLRRKRKPFHYFWSTANGYRQDDPNATQEMYDEIYPTFIEDKVIMEAQQERINLNPDRDLVEIHADSVLALARLSLDEMVEQDNQLMAQAAE